MSDRGRFDLGRSDSLAGELDRIVGASKNEARVLVVHHRPIAVDPDLRPARPICVEVTSGILPEPASHPDPRLADYQLANGAANRLPPIVDDVGVDPGNRTGKRARFEGRDGESTNNAAANLGS